jgi:hypothetical protein
MLMSASVSILSIFVFYAGLASNSTAAWTDSAYFVVKHVIQALKNVYGGLYLYESVFTVVCLFLFLYHIASELDPKQDRLVRLLVQEYDLFRILLLVVFKGLCFVSHMKLWASGSSALSNELLYIVQCITSDSDVDPFIYASTFVVQLQTSMVFARILIESALHGLRLTSGSKKSG